jgi:hypothetical protein
MNEEFKDELRSDCCNGDVTYSKGSYMGEDFEKCSICDRLCKTHTVKVRKSPSELAKMYKKDLGRLNHEHPSDFHDNN